MNHALLCRVRSVTKCQSRVVPFKARLVYLSSSSFGPIEDEQTTSFFQAGYVFLRRFTKGVKLLLNDYRTYRNIEAAIRTPRNAWKNGLPRRQLEQRRQFLVDIQIALPTISLFMLPIVGYLAPFLSYLFPRQLLSRQFQTSQQHSTYAILEYKTRQRYYVRLTEYLLQRCHIDSTFLAELRSADCDEAGPVIQNMALFLQFLFYPIVNPSHDSSSITISAPINMESLSTQRIHTLFQICGFSKLPPILADVFYGLVPLGILRSILRNIASSIVLDDACLLRESGDNNDALVVTNLTEAEVLEACILRGLPITSNTLQMRKCLCDHLILMRSVRQLVQRQTSEISWPSHNSDHIPDFLILLSLQLTAVRYGLILQAKDLSF